MFVNLVTGGEALKNTIIKIVIIVVMIGMGTYLYQSYAAKTQLEEDTISYLENEGYNREAETAEITIVNMGQEQAKYAAVVTFEDEPEIDYFYTYREGTEELYQINKVTEE